MEDFSLTNWLSDDAKKKLCEALLKEDGCAFLAIVYLEKDNTIRYYVGDKEIIKQKLQDQKPEWIK